MICADSTTVAPLLYVQEVQGPAAGCEDRRRDRLAAGELRRR